MDYDKIYNTRQQYEILVNQCVTRGTMFLQKEVRRCSGYFTQY